MWCGTIWCSGSFAPTTSTKHTSRSSRCCYCPAEEALRLPAQDYEAPRSRTHSRRTRVTELAKSRENRSAQGQVGYPSKENRRTKPVNARTFLIAGEASGNVRALTRSEEQT